MCAATSVCVRDTVLTHTRADKQTIVWESNAPRAVAGARPPQPLSTPEVSNLIVVKRTVKAVRGFTLSKVAEPRTRASPDDNSHHGHHHYLYNNYLRLDPRARPPFPQTGASKSAARRASPAAMPQGVKGAAPPVRCRGGTARAAPPAAASRTSRRRARGGRRNPAATQAGNACKWTWAIGHRHGAQRAEGELKAG